MIAKISHGSSLYGVLAYNQLKVDERHADVLFTSRIIEPQGDNPYTIGHLSRSFGDYLTANRKTEKPVLHISLNPDPKDCLSEERFVSLAEEYMRRMMTHSEANVQKSAFRYSITTFAFTPPSFKPSCKPAIRLLCQEELFVYDCMKSTL